MRTGRKMKWSTEEDSCPIENGNNPHCDVVLQLWVRGRGLWGGQMSK